MALYANTRALWNGSSGKKDTSSEDKDYQNNGPSVDGIVGENTWDAPTGSSPSNVSTKSTSTSASKSTSATTPKTSAADMKFSYDDYEKSDIVKQAEAMLNQQLSQKPGEYQSQWQTQLNEIMNKILNREDFSYDLNGDALYRQYKDQYTTQGKLAMMDTMGQAAALTGGYGSSYAQSVGQQAYQGYLQQLNDVVPELYQMAYDRYNQEGQDLLNQYSMLGAQEEQDYSRYRDTVSDYYTELDRLTEDARYKAEDDYGKWADKVDLDYGIFSDNRSYAYQQERNAVADAQWQKEFDEAQRQYDEQMSLAKKQADQSAQIDALNAQLKAKGEDTITLSTVNALGTKIESEVQKIIDKYGIQNGQPYYYAKVEELISKAADDGDINEAEYNYLMDKYYGTNPGKW